MGVLRGAGPDESPAHHMAIDVVDVADIVDDRVKQRTIQVFAEYGV